jgi:hypothetical protein
MKLDQLQIGKTPRVTPRHNIKCQKNWVRKTYVIPATWEAEAEGLQHGKILSPGKKNTTNMTKHHKKES